MSGHGHACVKCAGIGTVRIYGRPGSERQPCPACGGSGMLRPAKYNHATDCIHRGEWRLALPA